jgi:hypothetical protein
MPDRPLRTNTLLLLAGGSNASKNKAKITNAQRGDREPLGERQQTDTHTGPGSNNTTLSLLWGGKNLFCSLLAAARRLYFILF